MINLKKNKKSENTKSNQLHNPKILEVNLVKNELPISFNWSKNLRSLLMVLFVAVIFIVELYFGLNWWQEKEEVQSKTINNKIAQIDKQIIILKNNNSAALDYKAKSAAFSSLLATHVYWTNFFKWLEKNTLSTIKYTGFSGDLSGNYSLSALAPSYADVSWQVKAFLNDPLVLSAEVKSASLAKNKDKAKPDQVDFTILLKINPKIFKQQF